MRTWANVEAEARRRWGHLTAYRCGLVVGDTGSQLRPPAGKTKRWYGWFATGVADGLESKARRDAIIEAEKLS